LVNGNVGNGFNSLATADLDADGQLDLVGTGTAANGLGYVYVMLRTADGHFHLPVKYQTGKDPVSVAVGDFNRDGIADLATLNFDDDSVSILLGNGDGTFQPEVEYQTGNSRDFPDTLVVAD